MFFSFSVISWAFLGCPSEPAPSSDARGDVVDSAGEAANSLCDPDPNLTVSTQLVEFGALDPGASATQAVLISNTGAVDPDGDQFALGIGGVQGEPGLEITSERRGTFAVIWDEADVFCDEASDIRATAKSDSGSRDTSWTTDSDASPATEFPVIRLAPGCSLPVEVTVTATEDGELWGSLEVRTTYPGWNAGETDLDYGRDESDWFQQIYLHGMVDTGGRIRVDPPAFDLGVAEVGVETRGIVSISNTGSGALTLGDIQFAADCPGEFALASAPAAGTILAQWESGAVEVSFIPTEVGFRACGVEIASDDPEHPTVRALFVADMPTDSGESANDDDLDGYSEIFGDCDDADPSAFPGALELCDGVDSDCNGLKDETDGCVDLETEPIIVGEIEITPDACREGDVVEVSAVVFDADGEDIFYTWGDDQNTGGFASTNQPSARWTCPAVSSDQDGDYYTLYVLVTDVGGRQTWSSRRVAVYNADMAHYDYECPEAE